MPRELTLNDPLSGAEIKEIIRQKVSQALDRDCHLVDDVQYPGFTLKFTGEIQFVRSPVGGTIIWTEHRQGLTVNGGPDTEAVVDSLTAAYATDSPNKAREESNLPLPVMVQTPSGPQRQKVKFQKP
jgi:hypothetical protein